MRKVLIISLCCGLGTIIIALLLTDTNANVTPEAVDNLAPSLAMPQSQHGNWEVEVTKDSAVAHEQTDNLNQMPSPPTLNTQEIEQEIAKIDTEIADRDLIELANREALSGDEMNHLKTLLQTRNKFFAMKVALMLDDA